MRGHTRHCADDALKTALARAAAQLQRADPGARASERDALDETDIARVERRARRSSSLIDARRESTCVAKV